MLQVLDLGIRKGRFCKLGNFFAICSKKKKLRHFLNIFHNIIIL
jgi:hypothetical protein